MTHKPIKTRGSVHNVPSEILIEGCEAFREMRANYPLEDRSKQDQLWQLIKACHFLPKPIGKQWNTLEDFAVAATGIVGIENGHPVIDESRIIHGIQVEVLRNPEAQRILNAVLAQEYNGYTLAFEVMEQSQLEAPSQAMCYSVVK